MDTANARPTAAGENVPSSGFAPILLGGEGAQLQSMDAAGELLGEGGVDAALARDPVLPGEAGGDDLDPEMRLLAGMRAGVMAGMKMRIVVYLEPAGVERGLEFAANPVGSIHWNSHPKWAASGPKNPAVKRA